MEEEINLRELIEVIIRGKVFIAGVTIAAVLISGIISFFVLSPTYQAKSTLMVNQPNVQSREADNPVSVLLDSLSQYPMLTMETFRTQVKNPEILKRVIDNLGYEADEMTTTRLANKINVNAVNNTSLLEITVNDGDPIKAAEIANTVSQEFIVFINEHNKERMGQSAAFLQQQLVIESEKLDRAVVEQKEFLAQTPGVDELKQDIDSKLSLLTSFKASLVSKEIQLEQARAGLEVARAELKDTPQILTVKKSVIDDSLMSGVIKDTTDQDTTSIAGLKIESEEINPVYIYLTEIISTNIVLVSQTEAELSGLRREINSIQTDLEKLQAEYADKRTTHEQIDQKVETRRSTYQAFASKYEETRIAATAEMGDNTLAILSSAQAPDIPTSPNKKLNVAIAGVLGLMISVFIAFFREFWNNSNPRKNGPKFQQDNSY